MEQTRFSLWSRRTRLSNDVIDTNYLVVVIASIIPVAIRRDTGETISRSPSCNRRVCSSVDDDGDYFNRKFEPVARRRREKQLDAAHDKPRRNDNCKFRTA